MGAFVPLIVGLACAGLCVGVLFLLPKNMEPGTAEVTRVSVIMTFVCCYLAYGQPMCATDVLTHRWAFAYLAQLNPMFAPILIPPGH